MKLLLLNARANGKQPNNITASRKSMLKYEKCDNNLEAGRLIASIKVGIANIKYQLWK
jgi:hypothetical protein